MIRTVFWRKPLKEPTLLGRWYGRVEGEAVGLDFLPDGRLAYMILREGGGQQLIRMRYRVEGDTIITDQPSHPREERTRFTFESADVLILAFGGADTRFTR
jgi:hypothetical protein